MVRGFPVTQPHDLEYQSRFYSSPPHITAGHYQECGQVGERW